MHTRKAVGCQPASPSRAVMSMACRCTTIVTEPAARMNSTTYDVFFLLLTSVWSSFQFCQVSTFRRRRLHILPRSTTQESRRSCFSFILHIPVGAKRLRTTRKGTGSNLGNAGEFTTCPGLVKSSRSRSIHHTFSYTDRQGSQHSAVDIAAPRDTACVFFDLSKMEVREDRMDSRLRGEAPLALDKRARGNDGAVGSCTSDATMPVGVMPCNWSW